MCAYDTGLCRVATIGYHVIYKIVDTCIVRIYNNLSSRGQSSNEAKLVNKFFLNELWRHLFAYVDM